MLIIGLRRTRVAADWQPSGHVQSAEYVSLIYDGKTFEDNPVGWSLQDSDFVQSLRLQLSSSVNFEYSYEGFGADVWCGLDFKAGGCITGEQSAGTERMKPGHDYKLGAVAAAAIRACFDWSFGTWTVPFNSDNYQYCRYVVSNVTAPPYQSAGSVAEQTADHQQHGAVGGIRRPSSEVYKIYRYLEWKRAPFVLIDTVDAAESSEVVV